MFIYMSTLEFDCVRSAWSCQIQGHLPQEVGRALLAVHPIATLLNQPLCHHATPLLCYTELRTQYILGALSSKISQEAPQHVFVTGIFIDL